MNCTATKIECNTVEPKQGQIPLNLNTLGERVLYTQKLISEIFDIIEIPKPQDCSAKIDNRPFVPIEQTLAQRIYNIDCEVDSNNCKLREILNILREQLGSEKLV